MNVPPRQNREKARDFALRVLRENIISMGLEPGVRVSEKELADELGLSRTPVREAIIELANYGIIETFPQNGSVIAKIDYRHIEESNFMRLALETAAAEKACDIATDADMEELEDNIKIQKMYLDSGNTKMLLKMDNEFHQGIFAICDKLVCYALMQNMLVHFDRVRHLSLTTLKEIKIVEDHAKILAAIQSQNKQSARDHMTAHLTRFKADRTLISAQYSHFIKE